MNQNTNYKLSNIADKLDQLMQQQRELINFVAPLLPGTGGADILDPTVSQAIDEGRARGIATPANPNALGGRYIGKVLPEALDAFVKKGTNRTPTANLRLKALLNHFKKESNVNDLSLYDDQINSDHAILKSLARTAHDWLKADILKRLREEGKEGVLPPWGKVPSELVTAGCLRLEALANQHGLPIYKCNDSWAARLLLAEAHKNRFSFLKRKNKEVPAAADADNDEALFEGIREELASQDFINLNNDDNDAGSSLSLASSLAPSRAPSRASSVGASSVVASSVGTSREVNFSSRGARRGPKSSFSRGARRGAKSSSRGASRGASSSFSRGASRGGSSSSSRGASRGGSSSSGPAAAKKRRVIRQESED